MLHTSQPTISEHIHNLEAYLNCKLFDRLGRTIIPTAEAEILYPRAQAILGELHELKEEIISSRHEIKGELVIGASSIPGEYLLPPVIADFSRKYPETSFEIRIAGSTFIIESILANDLLLGITGSMVPAKGITYEPFVKDELILVAAAGSSYPERISVNALPTFSFLMRERGSGSRAAIEMTLPQYSISIDQIRPKTILNSNTAIKMAVKENHGIAFLSRYAVHDELKTGSIRQISISDAKFERSFYIVRTEKRSLPLLYTTFIEMLKNSSVA